MEKKKITLDELLRFAQKKPSKSDFGRSEAYQKKLNKKEKERNKINN